MQFITSGDRIAVENFTIGDLYTITFVGGTYINTACIGKGADFVTFQRNLPELLFSLTMETAELVSSIDLYAGGTGTSNYNELTNKPSIAGIELVGNKSLSDLGIQAEITAESPLSSSLVSGLGSAAAAESSDFASAAQGALAASAIQSAGTGLTKSGTTLNHSNSVTAQTSASFSSITFDAQGHITGSTAATTAQLNAINSGITSTDVAQIDINKTNILSDNIISTSFTWSGGYISTGGHIFSSSQSYFSQPFALHAGEKIVVRTKNKNICIIGSTTADSVAVGDNISILRTTSATEQYETYDYIATEDIKIVICVLASDYVAYTANHNTTTQLGSYATAAIKALEARVAALGG